MSVRPFPIEAKAHSFVEIKPTLKPDVEELYAPINNSPEYKLLLIVEVLLCINDEFL